MQIGRKVSSIAGKSLSISLSILLVVSMVMTSFTMPIFASSEASSVTIEEEGTAPEESESDAPDAEISNRGGHR